MESAVEAIARAFMRMSTRSGLARRVLNVAEGARFRLDYAWFHSRRYQDLLGLWRVLIRAPLFQLEQVWQMADALVLDTFLTRLTANVSSTNPPSSSLVEVRCQMEMQRLAHRPQLFRCERLSTGRTHVLLERVAWRANPRRLPRAWPAPPGQGCASESRLEDPCDPPALLRRAEAPEGCSN